jgi:F0F1-type ATP synthase membrane subunit c/vacuolar-type H+-ATPase subunit K
MAGWAIAGVAIAVVATGVSIGMSVDASNKNDARNKKIDKQNKEMAKQQGISSAMAMFSKASMGATDYRVQGIIAEEQEKQISKNSKGLKKNPEASPNFQIANKLVDKKQKSDNGYPNGKPDVA